MALLFGEQNQLCNFGRGHHEHFCEIIFDLDQCFRCHLKIFLLKSPFCSAEWNHLCNLGRGHYHDYEENF